ncbi:hypothetical protein ACFLX4_00395 [Chloroflexota bacterium]
MKTKMFKLMGLLLALAVLAMALPGVQAEAATEPTLSITASPGDGSELLCGESGDLVVSVCNVDEALAQDVYLTYETSGPITVTSNPMVFLGDICSGTCRSYTYTIECTGKGIGSATFTATASNMTTPLVQTFNYGQECGLEVNITEAPTSVEETDQFAITATVTNNTPSACEDVLVSITWTSTTVSGVLDGNPVTYPGPWSYTVPYIGPGETQEVNWTFHCDGCDPVGAPNEFTVTAEGCDVSGPCVTACAASVTVPQPTCSCTCTADIEILPPPELDGDYDVCVCDTFPVEVKVTNTGNCAIASGWYAALWANAGLADFPNNNDNIWERKPSLPSIPVGGDYTVTFDVHCAGSTDTDPCPADGNKVDLWATAWGSCTPNGSWATTGSSGTPPSPWSWGSKQWVSYPDYVDQQIIDLEITPVTCTDFCVGDDIWVEWTLRNCHPTLTWVGKITLNQAALGGSATVECFGTPCPEDFGLTLGPGQTASSDGNPLKMWHLECLGPGDVNIQVKATGIAGMSTTYCDEEIEVIHQKDPASIDVIIDAPECAQYCDEFTVTATVTNDGGPDAAPITNVVMSPDPRTYGDAALVSGPTMTGDTDSDGILPYGETWIYTWTYHCDGDLDPNFTAVVSGTDAVCDATVDDSSSDNDMEQIKIDVEIITPQSCEIIDVCDTFCVTATITDKDDDTDFDDTAQNIWVTIVLPNGLASLVDGEELTKPVNTLPNGDTEEVSWTVHCDGPGPTDITVYISQGTTDSGDNSCDIGAGSPDDTNKKDIITVQQVEAGLWVDIISPDTGAKYATSDEFAVTARITNNAGIGTVTVTDIAIIPSPLLEAFEVAPPKAEVVGGPDPAPEFDLAAGESENVTWTLHCVDDGPMFVWVEVTGVSEDDRQVWAHAMPILIWQYPAAQLEVEILSVIPNDPIDVTDNTTIKVCDNFTIEYKILNNGKADASEVEALLSVTPDGSARPVAGIDSGYEKYIGTIPGFGETDVLTWELHCKEACESTIEITPSGNDEYGWHIKQQSQNTGNFVIYAGGKFSEQVPWPPLLQATGDQVLQFPGGGDGWGYFFFFGEANNLPPGPFLLDGDASWANWNGQEFYRGHFTSMGFIWPHAEIPPMLIGCLMSDFCEGFDQVVTGGMTDPAQFLAGKDLMVLAYDLELATPMDYLGDAENRCVGPGLIEVINGTASGTWTVFGPDATWQDQILAGNFRSNLAAEPGREIPDEHIQSGWVTVKQIEVVDTDLEVVKSEMTEGPYEIGEEVEFEIQVTNLGPAPATSIWITDVLPAKLSLNDWEADLGYYYSMSGGWNVGDLDVGEMATLTIWADAVADGEDVCNEASVSSADQHDPVAGNNADLVCFTILPPAEPEPITCIDLNLGWNFISWPLIPDIPDLPVDGVPGTHVLSDLEDIAVNVDSVWGEFDPVAGADPAALPEDVWNSWDPSSLDPSLTMMMDGVGFWVETLTDDLEICVEGYDQPSPPLTPRVYDVVGGEGGYWNVIGFKATSPKLPEVYLAAIAGKFVIIYGFDSASQTYFIVGTPGHMYLEPGNAYWIAILESGKIFP